MTGGRGLGEGVWRAYKLPSRRILISRSLGILLFRIVFDYLGISGIEYVSCFINRQIAGIDLLFIVLTDFISSVGDGTY